MSHTAAIQNQGVRQSHQSAERALTRALKDAIDLKSGTLADSERVYEYDVDVPDYVLRDAEGMTEALEKRINNAISKGYDHLHDQGAAYRSIDVKVFTVTNSDDEPMGYGVWSGAPGDFGKARLQMFDADGHKIGQTDQKK